VEHFLELLTDPAHLAFEVTVSLLFDVLLLGIILPFLVKYIKRKVNSEHAKIDAEHGIEHHETGLDN
jgi:hypothetical protein